MPINDSAADPEPDAISLLSFGSEKRLKHSRQGVWGHAATGVGDGDDNSFSPCPPLRTFAVADKETAAPGSHCVDAIANEVAQNLQDLAFEAGDGMASAITSFHSDMGIE